MNSFQCQFSEPIDIGSSTPDWEYSKVDCECYNSTTELVANLDTGAEFYLRKTISYGEFLISTFLLILVVAFIIKIIFDLEIPKRINFKRQ